MVIAGVIAVAFVHSDRRRLPLPLAVVKNGVVAGPAGA